MIAIGEFRCFFSAHVARFGFDIHRLCLSPAAGRLTALPVAGKARHRRLMWRCGSCSASSRSAVRLALATSRTPSVWFRQSIICRPRSATKTSMSSVSIAIAKPGGAGALVADDIGDQLAGFLVGCGATPNAPRQLEHELRVRIVFAQRQAALVVDSGQGPMIRPWYEQAHDSRAAVRQFDVGGLGRDKAREDVEEVIIGHASAEGQQSDRVVVGILSADVDIEHGIGVRFSSRPGAAGEQAPDCNVTASHGVRLAVIWRSITANVFT